MPEAFEDFDEHVPAPPPPAAADAETTADKAVSTKVGSNMRTSNKRTMRGEICHACAHGVIFKEICHACARGLNFQENSSSRGISSRMLVAASHGSEQQQVFIRLIV